MGNNSSTVSNVAFEELGNIPRRNEEVGWIGPYLSLGVTLCTKIAFWCMETPISHSNRLGDIAQIGMAFGSLAYQGKEARMGASNFCMICHGAGFIPCMVCGGHKQVNDDSILGFCVRCGGIGNYPCPGCGGSRRA